VQVGQSVEATYSLFNSESETIEACFGPGRGYNILGTKDARGQMWAADHPNCESRFRLESGQVVTTHIQMEIPNVGPGPARVNAWVEIVDPDRCDRYGCDSMNITTALAPLLTVRAETP
jgi:hypothetical protein